MKMTVSKQNCKYNASNKGRKLGYQKGVTFLAHTVSGKIEENLELDISVAKMDNFTFSMAGSENPQHAVKIYVPRNTAGPVYLLHGV